MDDLTIDIGADSSGLERGLSAAQRRISEFMSQVERIGDIGRELTSLGTQLTASVTLPIVGLGVAAVKAYGDIEALQKGLAAVAGSAEIANQQFNELKEVAKLPGLGLNEAVKGSINLQAIGISASKSKDILLQFGNAVATVGKGRAEFERAIYGVQQLANTDFPLGEDLNIIKDAIPQVSNLLTEAFGANRSDQLKDLGISSQQVLDVILNGLGKLPRVSGGINGAFENLKDSMTISLSRIGKIINDNLDISGLVDKITEFVDKIVSKFESLDPTIQQVILVVAGLAAAAGPLLLVLGGLASLVPTIVTGFGAISTVVGALLSPVGLLTVALVGVVTAVVANWDKIRPYLEETIDRFKRLYNESTAFRLAINSVVVGLEVLARGSLIAVKTIYENFKDLGKGILNIFSGVGDVLEGALTFDFDLLKKGITKTFAAVNTARNDFFNNSINGYKQLGDLIVDVSKKNAAFRFDLSKKTDLSFGFPKTTVNETTGGGGAGGGTKGGKKTKIKAPDIEELTPVKFELRGLLDELGNEYKNFNDYYSAQVERTQMISDRLPKALSAGEIAIAKSTAFMSELTTELNENLSSLITDSISSSITDVFSSIGTAIAEGGNVIGAIGQSLLKSFSGFLSQMGGLLIKYGTLAVIKGKLDEVIKTGGYQAIAAGIAAIAIGAALSFAGAALGSAAKGGMSGSTSTSTETGASTGNNYSGSYTSGGGFSSGGEIILRASGPDLVTVINRNVIEQDRLSAG